MKKTRQWAVNGLLRNRVHVDTRERVIFLPERGPGLKMWRLIDCLCNYFKFRWVREKHHV